LLQHSKRDFWFVFIGDDKGGCGQLFVTLRESVFDPSWVFDHCTQLVDTLQMKVLKVTILVLKTNSGPDHSLRRVTTRFALLAMVKLLNVNRLVALCCAPNGSAMNKVERGMSVLDLPLKHGAIVTGDMASWTEKTTKGDNTMSMMRTIAANSDKAQNDALAMIPALQAEVKASLIVEIIETKI
jgi:hypothetical protein